MIFIIPIYSSITTPTKRNSLSGKS